MAKYRVLWKPVKGYETRYEVSKDGVVRNIESKVPLKQHTNSWKYPCVSLIKTTGKSTTKAVSRIMAEVFLGLDNNELEVVHRDGDKMNLDLKNLRIDSKSEQLKNAYRNGNKTVSPRSGVNKVCVNIYLKETGEFLCSCWSTQAASRLTGVPQSNISLEINGKLGKVRGTASQFRFERA